MNAARPPQDAHTRDSRFLELLFTPEFNQELMQVESLQALSQEDDHFIAQTFQSPQHEVQRQASDAKASFQSLYAEWHGDGGNAPSSPGLFAALDDRAPEPGPLAGNARAQSTEQRAFSSELYAASNSAKQSFHRGSTSTEGPSRSSSDRPALTGTTTSTSGPLDTSGLSAGSSGALLGGSTSSGLSAATTAMEASAFVVQPAIARTAAQVGTAQGMGTTQAGWQALLQKVQQQEAPVAPPPPPLGPRRGRKPTHMVNGIAIAKPVKDKKRENSILIRQLEAQLAEKLTLVKGLEGENTELKRKERLLQMSVDTSESNISHLADPTSLDQNLEPMLKSFRSTYNRSAAERVLATYTKGKGITFDIFVSCWQAIVMEMCDALVADATASTTEAKAEVEAHLQGLQQQLVDFIMAVCATDLSIIRQAKTRNVCTGEEAESYTFWQAVIEKLALTPEQLLDLLGAYDMFTRLFQRNLRERGELKRVVDEAVAQDALVSFHRSDALLVEAKVRLADASEQLARNMRQAGVLHSMLSFMTMKILNAKQVAQLCMHAAPYFPSIVHMQVVLRRTAEQLGVLQPMPITQAMVAARFAHGLGPGAEPPPPPLPSSAQLPVGSRLAPQAVCT